MPLYQDMAKILAGRKLGDRYKSPARIPPPPRPGRPGIPQQTHVVTLGETYADIAERFKIPTTDVMRAAENLEPIPGTAISFPKYPETGLSVRPGYTPEPLPKIGLETAETTDVGLQYPTGWNPYKTTQAAPYMTMDYLGKYYGGDYTVLGGMPTDPKYMTMDYATKLAEGAYATEELPYFPGIPTYHAWEKDPDTGAWDRKSTEAVFDALYEMNDIDPTDDDAVEYFWSFADEDLLGVGVLFDVFDWGGEGGYGYPAPAAYGLGTPSRMAGRGQKPVRGEYASYLGLTSWSI